MKNDYHQIKVREMAISIDSILAIDLCDRISTTVSRSRLFMSTHAHGTLMAEKRRKRQADDDPDWVPGGFLPQKKRQKVA